ncbi:hypothetical protein ACOBQB_33215 [Streptomyces sp. G5(2025)]|uniref:hypothetical protein n=1 Tax=Streptomyces sp. G5(2025) TaxID=3406628 RepID=UPI003C1F717B
MTGIPIAAVLEEDEEPSDETFFLVSAPRPVTAAETASPPDAAGEPEESGQGFVEDETPGGDGDPAFGPRQLSENESPENREVVGLREPRKIDETRHTLAMGLLWLVGLIAGAPTLALLAGHWTHFSTEAYREVSLVFTPVVALASAAFGFFFASDDRSPRL